MKNRIIIAALLLRGATSCSSIQYPVSENKGPSFVHKALAEPNPKSKIKYKEGSEYSKRVVQRICDGAGINNQYPVYSGPIQNAMAYYDKKLGGTIIVYDPEFMSEIKNGAGNSSAGVCILAHEIGHHLFGHTTTGRLSDQKPIRELESDLFSGWVLSRMGYSLEDVKAWHEVLFTNQDSETHPATPTRLLAVELGYNKGIQGVSLLDLSLDIR